MRTFGKLAAAAAAAVVGYGVFACGDRDAASPRPPSAADASTSSAWRFPDKFLFGTAIAGFQSDMGCPTLPRAACEDAASDWFEFSTSPITVADPGTFLSGQHPSDVGPGFWELYDQDIARASSELGNDALRISIEWSRIFPTATDAATTDDDLRKLASAPALATYHAMFASMRARRMTPLVTLNHYSLPTWIHDGVGCHRDLLNCKNKGWADRPRIVREIAKYAGFVAKEFGSDVDLWATLNEPMAVIFPGYVSPGEARSNPPAVTFQSAAAKTAMVAMVEAHARMYDAVKANDTADADGDGTRAAVGVVYNITPIVAKNPARPLDVKGAENLFYLWNLALLNGFCRGDVDEDLDGTAVHRDDLAGRSDYVGINYYNRWRVAGVEQPMLPDFSVNTTFDPDDVATNDVYPRGIYEVTMLVKERYALPVMITESGTSHSDHPEIMEGYFTDHLRWLLQASRDGADVRGYFYWTLMDNFEWNHGMRPRLGLFAVDANDKAKTRVARPSAATYAEIAKARAIPSAFVDRHPDPTLPSDGGAR